MSSAQDSIQIARNLIDRHGLRAGAVAEQAASEAQLAGQAAELDRWRSVQAAIAELRRTAHQGAKPAATR